MVAGGIPVGGGGGKVNIVTRGSASRHLSASGESFIAIVNLPDITGITIVDVSIANFDAQGNTITGVTLGGATVNLLKYKPIGGDAQPYGGPWLGYVLNSVIGSTGNKDLVPTYAGGGNVDILCGVVCLSGQNGSDASWNSSWSQFNYWNTNNRCNR